MGTNKAKMQISRVFEDISVTPEETAARLKELREFIDENLQLLAEDGVDIS